jgi:predicted metal-dependent phosphoesterase TrpH
MSELRLDMHVHTHFSPDGFTDPRAVLRRAEQRGLDGVAITDHDEFDPDRYRKLRSETDLLLVPGQEVTTTDGHVLAYFIESEIESFRSPEAVVEDVHEQGGLAVFAHPYRLAEDHSEERLRMFDAIERFNARSGPPGDPLSPNGRTRERLDELDSVSVTGGSDSHLPWTVGNAWTIFEGERSLSSLREELLEGRTRDRGEPSFQFNRVLSKGKFMVNYPEAGGWANYAKDSIHWVGQDLKRLATAGLRRRTG